MKKIIVILLTVAFICLSAIPVFAVEDSSVDSVEETSVETTIEESSEEASGNESSEETTVTESTEDVSEKDDAININFSTKNLGKAAKDMGIGMLGVFIVLGLIACVVVILNKIFKPKA